MGKEVVSRRVGVAIFLFFTILFNYTFAAKEENLRNFNGVDYLPLSGITAHFQGKCWLVRSPEGESRFVAILPGAKDSLPIEYTFLVDSNLVIHNGKRLQLPLPAVMEKDQLYLPAVVAAAIFPELDVPILSTIETERVQDTLVVRLLLSPFQKKTGALLFHHENSSSIEFRLTLGARIDSGFVQELRLLSLTSTGSFLNGIKIDSNAVGTSLIWTFRQPVEKTIISREQGIEVRVFPRPKRQVAKILLDPGHGGKDPGAIGTLGTEEKTVVLDIAKRTKEHLVKNGFEVYLTREGDEYVTLAERAEKAIKTGADIFVSIHANWAENKAATGLETYFLSEAKTDWERAVAARENAVFEREIANPLIKDKNNPVGLILADLAQNEFLYESSELAARIQESSLGLVRVQDRGVKQANFYVLRNIFMPAILVECGFLSNRQEEKLLRTPECREKIARAIAEGIASFARDYERRLNGASKNVR
ncbi:MAG: N-acetylmuramoyl-L-alanine amidase [candidate division WOR-3 bacterium]